MARHLRFALEAGLFRGGVGANNVAVVATGPGKVAIEMPELLGASGMYATFGAQVDMKARAHSGAQYQCHRKPGLRRWSPMAAWS